MNKTIISRIFTSIIAATMLALAFTACGKGGSSNQSYNKIDRKWTVPEGYNENDYDRLVNFFETKDEEGVKNGEKQKGIDNYSPNDPEPWSKLMFASVIKWVDVDGEKRLQVLELAPKDGMRFSGALDLAGCSELVTLKCGTQNITSVDVRGCTALKTLYIGGNHDITSIDLSTNKALKDFSCSCTSITELDVSKNPELQTLSCGESYGDVKRNVLKSINMSNNPNLKVLDCERASITKLDLTKLPALEEIRIDNLLITELDVSHNPALKKICCRSNDISELDVSHNPELRRIVCKGTNIKKLDVTNTKVDYIECERDCEVIGFNYNGR